MEGEGGMGGRVGIRIARNKEVVREVCVGCADFVSLLAQYSWKASSILQYSTLAGLSKLRASMQTCNN